MSPARPTPADPPRPVSPLRPGPWWQRGRTARQLALLALALALALAPAACQSSSGSTPPTDSTTPPTDSTPPPSGSSTPQIESACQDQSSLYSSPATPFTYADSVEVPVPSVATSLNTGLASVTFTLPETAVAVGLLAQGSDSGPKFIDHGILLSPTECITTPLGNAPLSFNRVDFDSPPDGVLEDDPSSLINYQAPAVVFPNNGTQLTLPPGAYHFVAGALDSTWSHLVYDTFQPRVYYKVPTSTQTTLRVNLFVAQGVRTGLQSVADLQNDPEIQGAIGVLRNVYEANPATALKLQVRLGTVPSSYVTLTSYSQLDTLASSYPTPPANDAVNVFVIGTIALPGSDPGEVGEALGLPGPFNRQGTVVSGVVAEYQGDPPGPGAGTVLGFTLAHELGHYLGLFHTSQTDGAQTAIIGHDPIADTPVCTTAQASAQGGINNCPDRHNLMFPIVDDNPDPVVTAQQGTVVRLDPAVQVQPWSLLAALPQATCCMGSAVTGGKLYLLGGLQAGVTSNPPERDAVLVYDPATDTWDGSLATMPTARSGLAAAAVNGIVYAIGGTHNGTASTAVEAYDPATDSWSSKTPMPTTRSGASAAVVNGTIYLIGGADSAGTLLATVEAYDPGTDAWSTGLAPMPTARYDLTTSVVSGKIYVIGGSSAGPTDPFSTLATVEVYDPASDTWNSTPLTAMPTSRMLAMSSSVNGKILVVGGLGDDGSGPAVLATAELYDPATDTWQARKPMATHRELGGIGTVGNDVIVAGGRNDTASFLDAAEAYDATVEP